MLSSDRITTKLQEKYENVNYLTRFMSDKPYPLTDSYINLVIVKQEEVKDKEQNLQNKEFRDERLATYESLHEVTQPIVIKDIFTKQDNKEVKKVVVYGRAGIGKSTLCKYFAVKWQEGSLWPDKFKAVFWLPLRNLLNRDVSSTAKIIEAVCIDGDSKPSIEEIQQFLKSNSDKVLFILDGYDEVASVLGQNQPLEDALKRILTERAYHVIVTSRPMPIAIEGAVFDKQLENVGFTNENIKQYLEKFYPDSHQKLLKFLNQNKSIWGIAHIPINLDLICSIWQPSTTTQEAEYTMSKLYIKITEKLLNRYLKTQKILSKADYEVKLDSITKSLECLAYEATLSNQIIIPNDKIKKLDSHLEILASGLVKTVGEASGNENKDVYFLHLTFQEFYAASYIARSLENIGSEEYKQAKEQIAKHKYDPYYQVIWWFVAGILYERGKERGNYLGLMHFWNAIESHPRALTGFKHVNLVIRCVDECMADEKVPGVSSLILSLIPHLDNWVSCGTWHNPYRIIEYSLSISPHLVKNKQFYTVVNAALNYDAAGVRRYAASALEDVANGSKESVAALIEALTYNNDVKNSAASTLGMIGGHSKEVIIQLIDTFKKASKAWVRSSVTYVLKNIEGGFKEAISILIEDLKDKKKDDRWSVASALGRIGENSQEAIAALITALKDNDNRVRSSAASALGEIEGESKEAIGALIDALKDNNGEVRKNAAGALGQIRGDSKEAIAALIDAVKDTDESVRKAAVFELGRISGSKEVIVALIEALNDRESAVRWSAGEALGKIGKGSKEAIAALIDALKDKEIWVRRNAANSLGKIGENSKEAIAALIDTLKDSNDMVRQSAGEALGMIGENSKEAMAALIDALKDKDENVRSSATYVLSKIGNDSKEVIAALIQALNNNDNWVKRSAASALSKLMLNNNSLIKTVAIANKKDDNAIFAFLEAQLPLSILMKCYLISNDPTWLGNPPGVENLFFSNSLVLLDQANNTIFIQDEAFTGKLPISKEQAIVLLTALENQAKEANLPTNVFEYYRGVGKLGLNSNLDIKELTPLHLAAQDGDLEKVKEILTLDTSDIDNQHNEQQDTPLMLAVKRNHWPVVQHLITAKADISCFNKKGEYVAGEMLRPFCNNKEALNLVLKEYCVREPRLQTLLENAVLSYSGLSGDQTVEKVLFSIGGSFVMDWRTNGLITTYRMYLDDLSVFQMEHQSEVKADGQNVPPILAMRLYFYTELYLKLQKGLVIDLPKIEGSESRYSVQDILSILQKEISIISNTIANANLNLERHKIPSLELVRTLSLIRAEGILERLQNAGISYECNVPSGYLVGENGHCIYVGLQKLNKNQILARVDNRWLTQEYKDIYKQNGYLKSTDTIDVIKSYCVGVFTLPNHYELLKDYIAGVIYAFCNNKNTTKEAFKLIYGQYLLNAHTALPLMVTQVTEAVQIKINSWPFHNIQRNTKDNSPDNCTLSSHNLGVSVRCGETLFKWFKFYELQCVPSLANANYITSSQTNSGPMKGSTPDSNNFAISFSSLSSILANHSYVRQNVGGLRGIKFVKHSTHNQLDHIGAGNHSHEELMKQFTKQMHVDYHEVYRGIIVEQTLVNMAGLTTPQTNAIFRATAVNRTAFSLRFSSALEHDKFINYYDEHFPGLITQVSSYKHQDFTVITMDTSILYNKVSYELGLYLSQRRAPTQTSQPQL